MKNEPSNSQTNCELSGIKTNYWIKMSKLPFRTQKYTINYQKSKLNAIKKAQQSTGKMKHS